jgi:hypothetical protein
MQTRSKKTAARPQAKPQLERFKAMAEEVGADESPDALNRAFAKLNARTRPKPAKPK